MDPLNQNPIAGGNQMPVSPSGDRGGPVSPEEPKTGVGPIAGAVIVILLLVAGGLYYWGAKLNEDIQRNSIPYIPEDTSFEEMPADAAPASNASDDVSSIEADFNAMDFGGMDAENQAELNNI